MLLCWCCWLCKIGKEQPRERKLSCWRFLAGWLDQFKKTAPNWIDEAMWTSRNWIQHTHTHKGDGRGGGSPCKDFPYTTAQARREYPYTYGRDSSWQQPKNVRDFRTQWTRSSPSQSLDIFRVFALFFTPVWDSKIAQSLREMADTNETRQILNEKIRLDGQKWGGGITTNLTCWRQGIEKGSWYHVISVWPTFPSFAPQQQLTFSFVNKMKYFIFKSC